MTRHLLVVALLGLATTASANPLSKEACVDAHSKGQDARDSGKISLARKLFLTCAQAACPALVQNDCARFADDLNGQQPTISFIARDASGADLPDTTVYVDDELIVTRLDDGRPHDADPGKHVVRFSNGGHDMIVTIVLNAGEKGRQVVAKFGDINNVTPNIPVATPTAALVLPPAPKVTHPKLSKLLIAGGGAALLGGAAATIIGMLKVPSNCSLSTHECVGAPGDPSFNTAHSAARLVDIGYGVAGIGAAVLTGGLIWYFTGSKTEHDGGMAAVPWVSPTGGGFALSGSL